MFGPPAVLGVCLWIAACGPGQPKSPLILGDEAATAVPGARTLSGSQSRALQKVITSAGEPCAAIERVYLRNVNADAESWEVSCTESPYTVMIRADGAPNMVRRCLPGDRGDSPCMSAYGGRRYRNPAEPDRESAPLNPDLGKLLEPMTAKDGKND
jgi:hypothetical protein